MSNGVEVEQRKIERCSSGFWCREDSSVDANVSEKNTVSIFRAEVAENGDSIFLRNAGIFRQVYTAPKPRRASSTL
jgi:hypothetical protein